MIGLYRNLAAGALVASVFLAGCGPTETLDPEVERLGRATGPLGFDGPASSTRMPPTPMSQGGEEAGIVHTGEVVETFNVPNYTYLLLRTASGAQRWAAVPQFEAKVGATVEVAQSLVMNDFTSPSLGRTFDEIVFGTLVPKEAAAGTPPDASTEGASPEERASLGAVALPPGHPPIDEKKR